MIKKIINYEKRMADAIKPYVLSGSLLDIGCGDGGLTRLIGQGVSTFDGVDVVPNPYAVYDGKLLPFQDKQFCQSVLSFVLHHCQEPKYILDEAVRVTARRIIVTEDIADSSTQRAWNIFHDWVANKLTNPGIEMTYQFKSRVAWRRLFAEAGLQVIEEKRISSCPWNLVNQRIFILETEKKFYEKGGMK